MLRCFNVGLGSAVTFNSNNGSVPVLGRMTAKVTVKGTRPRMGTITSCIAASMSRSKVTGTLGRFKLVWEEFSGEGVGTRDVLVESPGLEFFVSFVGLESTGVFVCFLLVHFLF